MFLVRVGRFRCNRAIKNLQEAKLPGDLATLNLKLFNVPVDESVVRGECEGPGGLLQWSPLSAWYQCVQSYVRRRYANVER